jgi:hypothetical protein
LPVFDRDQVSTGKRLLTSLPKQDHWTWSRH